MTTGLVLIAMRTCCVNTVQLFARLLAVRVIDLANSLPTAAHFDIRCEISLCLYI